MDLGELPLSPRDGAVRFAVRVKPRASRTEILGMKGEALEIAVSAPPVDGEANEELVRGLAKALGVSRRDVAVVSGQTGRSKVVEVRGLALADVRARLAEGSK